MPDLWNICDECARPYGYHDHDCSQRSTSFRYRNERSEQQGAGTDGVAVPSNGAHIASVPPSPVPPTPAELDEWAKEYMAKKAKQAKPRCGKCGEPLNVTNLEPPYPCADCGCLTWEPKYRTDAEQARYEAKAGR